MFLYTAVLNGLTTNHPSTSCLCPRRFCILEKDKLCGREKPRDRDNKICKYKYKIHNTRERPSVKFVKLCINNHIVGLFHKHLIVEDRVVDLVHACARGNVTGQAIHDPESRAVSPVIDGVVRRPLRFDFRCATSTRPPGPPSPLRHQDPVRGQAPYYHKLKHTCATQLARLSLNHSIGRTHI